MTETVHGLKLTLPVPYTVAVAQAIKALKDQGITVVSTIDIEHATTGQLGRRFREQLVLGACNPGLPHDAIAAEIDGGLLLPCNVIVYETGRDTSVVAAMAPRAALGLVGDNADLAAVAVDADERLRAAVAALEAALVPAGSTA